MNNQKHTPGPWRIEMKDNYMKLYMPASRLDGDVARGYVGEANARLIAAAPELLEACEALARLCERFGVNPVTVSGGPSSLDRARAAIAKAEGEG